MQKVLTSIKNLFKNINNKGKKNIDNIKQKIHPKKSTVTLTAAGGLFQAFVARELVGPFNIVNIFIFIGIVISSIFGFLLLLSRSKSKK